MLAPSLWTPPAPHPLWTPSRQIEVVRLAAVVLGVSTPSTANNGAGVAYASASFTPAANDLLVVLFDTAGNTDSGSQAVATGSAGLTFTTVDVRRAKNANADSVHMKVADQLTTAVAQTVSVTHVNAATGCNIVVLRVSGMSKTGAAAIRGFGGAAAIAAAATPAVTLSATALTTNPLVGIVGNQSNPAGLTPPTGWTEVVDTASLTPTNGIEVVSRDSGFTSNTVTWGSTTATSAGAIAAELDASAADDLIPYIGGGYYG